MRTSLVSLSLMLALGGFACNRGPSGSTVVSADASASSAAPNDAASVPTFTTTATPAFSASAAPSGAPSASASAATTDDSAAPASSAPPSASALASAAPASGSAGAADAEPPLKDADGKLLPQTEDKPSLDSPLFKRHLDSLVQAIVNDDPELAKAFFFPVEAYEAVKAIKEPGKDWKRRLFRAFEKSVHQYHKKLGKHAEGTKLVRLDVDEERAKWMKPGSEGNKLGYYRVTKSHLILEDGKGKERKFELTSMISWRGEWYVVHLHGFK
jgi:hypothetical protein